MRYDKLAYHFERLGLEVEVDAPMAQFTSFQIGGPADLLVTAKGPNDIAEVFNECYNQKIPVLLMGNGTNMLVSDKGVDGMVVRMTKCDSPVIENDTVMCPAGVSLKKLCTFTRDAGLSGLEFAYGIPGSVGGAVHMNAGAYCGQISDVFQWADVLFPDGRISRIEADRSEFGYRHSIFMKNGGMILSAGFRLLPDSPDEIGLRMDEYLNRRRKSQPLNYPSAGSFFKRPTGHYAGALIEQCGLKGFGVGAARISSKHAGFVVNCGGASCSDVLALVDIVTERVLSDCGVKLEPEVRYIGRF